MNPNNTTTVFKRTDVHQDRVVGAAPVHVRATAIPPGAIAAGSTGPLHLESEKEKHGILHDMKEGIKDVVHQITGHEFENKTPKDHLKEAKKLEKKAEHVLKDTKKEFKKADKLQHKAEIISEEANAKTAFALNKQARGQELLAEAGAELIEAGAMLQKEAGEDVNATHYNIHKTGDVRQTTCIDGAAAHAHHSAVRVVEYGATH